MLMIGSCAMNAHYGDMRLLPKDRDWIATIEEFEDTVSNNKNKIIKVVPMSSNSMVIVWQDGAITEFSIAWPDSTNEMLLNLRPNDPLASPDMLLMLKLSHRYKKNSPHFLKTMRDIQFLRRKGAVVEGELLDILKLREAETYNYAHPNLAQKKQGFFKESDSLYVWEHDDIHKAVAVMESPAYTKFSKDGAEVMVSKKKWNKLDEQTKLLAGLEESYVLAIERSLVPFPDKLSRKEAFDKALEKVCTSITSGWFREYCWENYDKIQELYSDTYYDKFLWAVENGYVRKFNV